MTTRDDLVKLGERIEAFKKQLIAEGYDPDALAKDWAKWDAEHEGLGPKWGDGKWKLTGVQTSKGQCDHCGRNIGKVFQVEHPDGHKAMLGSSCAKKATGFSNVQRAADNAKMVADRDQRRADKLDELRSQGHGGLIDNLKGRPQTVMVGGSLMASSAKAMLDRLGDGQISPEDARNEMDIRD